MSFIFKPYNIGCQPSPSVPAETLIAGTFSTYLLFFAVSESLETSGNLTDLGVAVVECKNCTISLFGYPNDEGFHEHPLYEHGLSEINSAVIEVVESDWLKEVTEQKAVSAKRIWAERSMGQYGEQDFSRKHFIIPLKEKTFECIATELVVVRYAKNFQEATEYVFSKFNTD